MSNMDQKRVHKFLCTKCQYVYNPSEGGGTAPANTAFESLPADWVCPKCSASAMEFKKKYEVVYIDIKTESSS